MKKYPLATMAVLVSISFPAFAQEQINLRDTKAYKHCEKAANHAIKNMTIIGHSVLVSGYLNGTLSETFTKWWYGKRLENKIEVLSSELTNPLRLPHNTIVMETAKEVLRQNGIADLRHGPCKITFDAQACLIQNASGGYSVDFTHCNLEVVPKTGEELAEDEVEI